MLHLPQTSPAASDPPPASSSGEDSSPLDLQAAADTVIESVRQMCHDLLASLPQLAIGILVVMGTWLVATVAQRVLRRMLKRTRLRGSLVDLFIQLTNALLWIIGLLLAATVVFPGVTPAKLLTVLGLSSIAVGFAFKDIFENFFAGILILWRFPLEKGDVIEVDGIMGRVEEVTIRMTQIRQMDDQLVVLPNGHLFKQAVTVSTNRDLRRVRTVVGVAYDADQDEARRIIQEAVESCDAVSSAKPVQVFAEGLGASSVDFEVTWWSGSDPLEQRTGRDAVVRAVKRALDDAGIEIPFPQRTLTFHEPLHTLRDDPSEQS